MRLGLTERANLCERNSVIDLFIPSRSSRRRGESQYHFQASPTSF
jgi:hypothetical protein